MSEARATTENRDRPLRVLLAKPGLDGHDRGVKVVLRALRDAGMEVIYSGIRATPAGIAQAAQDEDVEAIGISNLSGAYPTLFPAIVEALVDRGVDLSRVVLFAGGTIPPHDHAQLQEIGFRRIFSPGASTADIVEFLERETGRSDDES